MFYLFLGILLFKNILCYTQIPGVFNTENLLSGYITPENNMLIFSTSINKNLGLYKYEMDKNKSLYTKGYELKLTQFSSNSSEIFEDFYFHFDYINSSIINITIFNEKYFLSYTYNKSLECNHISIDVIGQNKLAIFYDYKNYSKYNISIATFDYKNMSIYIQKSYSIDRADNCNCYCTSTSNNNIVCGLVREYNNNGDKFFYNYSLILLQEDSRIKIIDINSSYNKNKLKYGLFNYYFFKLIPLENNRIIYCYPDHLFKYSQKNNININCGLVQIRNNSNIVIIIKNQRINNNVVSGNFFYRYNFDGIKLNDNEVVIAFIIEFHYDEYLRIIFKLKISNNNGSEYTFLTEANYLNLGKKIINNKHNYLQLLKNKNNDLIYLIIFNNNAQFHELGYSFCENNTQTIFNGDKKNIFFDMFPALYKAYNNNIIFLNEKKLNSLIYMNGKEINNFEVYDKNEIYFKLSLKDFNDIKKDGEYKIIFSNILNENKSQICQLILEFEECDSNCEICTESQCYDHNWINVYETETKKLIIIISVFIFSMVFIIIGLIIVSFIYTFRKRQRYLPRRNNNNQNDMLLNGNNNNIQ